MSAERLEYAKMRLKRLEAKKANLEGSGDRSPANRKALNSTNQAIRRWTAIVQEITS